MGTKPKAVIKQEAPAKNKIAVKKAPLKHTPPTKIETAVRDMGESADEALEKEIVDTADAKLMKLSVAATNGGVGSAKELMAEAQAQIASAGVDLKSAEARKATIVGEIAQLKQELMVVKAQVASQLNMTVKPSALARMFLKNQNETETKRDALLVRLSKAKADYAVSVEKFKTFSQKLPLETQKWVKAQKNSSEEGIGSESGCGREETCRNGNVHP